MIKKIIPLILICNFIIAENLTLTINEEITRYGYADSNNNKQIKASELFNYLTNNVNNEAQKIDRIQNPQLIGSDTNRLLLTY